MTRKSEILVGIVFFGALTILGYFTVLKSDYFDKKEYIYASVVFKNVEGLVMGSLVKINGVSSGKVVGIFLIEDGNVKVDLKIFNKFVLYDNYRIALRPKSALGGMVVSIFPGKSHALGRDAEVVTDLTLLKGFSSGEIMGLVSEILTENRVEIRETLVNLKNFTAKLNSSKGTLGKFLNDDTIHNKTGKLVDDLREAVEDAREQAPVTSFIRAALTAF